MMEGFISIMLIDPAHWSGSAVVVFKSSDSEKVWVGKSSNIHARLTLIKNAIKNGHYGKGLVPKGLQSELHKPENLLVKLIGCDVCVLDETYDYVVNDYDRLNKRKRRRRDSEEAIYGFGVLTHPLAADARYYFKYKMETGFKRATLALRHRCLELSLRSIMSRGLGVWIAGRSLWFINRLKYTEIPGVYVTGSAAAREELKRLVQHARAQGKVVYNHIA